MAVRFYSVLQEGTGIIAGGGVRAVLEGAGIKNILSKSLGSNNPLSVVGATMKGLLELRSAEQISKFVEKPFLVHLLLPMQSLLLLQGLKRAI